MQARDIVEQIRENCDHSMFSKTTELVIALGIIKDYNLENQSKAISEIAFQEIIIRSQLKHYDSESDMLIKEYFDTFNKVKGADISQNIKDKMKQIMK